MEVIRTGHVACGPQTWAFERELAEYWSAPFCVTTNSGTAALHLALLAVGVKPGDEVIVPSYVCAAVLNAVRYSQAREVVVDCACSGVNLDPEGVKKSISCKTAAIVVPHMFGQPARVNEIGELGPPVIEDIAQSPGAFGEEGLLGTVGRMAVVSFYATKLLTTGAGGAILAKDRADYEFIGNLVDYDKRPDYQVRFNYRMGDLAAAIGRVQLRRLDGMLGKRKKLAKRYEKALQNFPNVQILTPTETTFGRPVFYRFVVAFSTVNIEELMTHLEHQGIEAKRPVYAPLHHMLHLDPKDFPQAETIHQQGLSLPLYPDLTESEQDKIIASLSRFLQRNDLEMKER